jgi:hypothetical protein
METPRKNSVMSYSYDTATRLMAWDFGTAIGRVEYTLPDYGLTEFGDSMLHNGAKQKIADAAALGQGATAREKFDAMSECVENLRAERWNLPRGESDVATYLARAIVDVDGKNLESVKKWLAGKKPAERAALAAVPKYADKIAEYRRAKVAGVAVPDVGEIE